MMNPCEFFPLIRPSATFSLQGEGYRGRSALNGFPDDLSMEINSPAGPFGVGPCCILTAHGMGDFIVEIPTLYCRIFFIQISAKD
jgi:hypothetical protein